LSACSSDLPSRSQLADARILAVIAEPLEIAPGESVSLRPVTWTPPGDAVAAHEWRFCPFTLGAASGYACALPACEVALVPAADGAVTADPLALAQQCLATAAAAGGTAPEGIPSEIPDRVELAFRYRVTTTAGTVRDAVALVPFYARGVPVPRNLSPVIERVEIGGIALAPGGEGPPLRAGAELELRVVLDPASAQPYTDLLGAPAVEALVVSFFATAGKLDGDRADGPDARQILKGEDLGADAAAEVWVVARDLRGGQAVSGPYRVPIAR
ncbi:MAG TPA: hypothetical protein VFK85_07440, partial [Anaeromyxobacteraceae bacterium]|nr:hypothetical protein [Anaeromyxobacteraceae bacterium]